MNPAGPRMSLRQVLLLVVALSVAMGLLRTLLRSDVLFGFGTVYTPGYSETRFQRLRPGMTALEVEQMAGAPLHKWPWNQHLGPHDEEMWFYSEGPNGTANYWRRWVHFRNGRATVIISDFWVD